MVRLIDADLVHRAKFHTEDLIYKRGWNDALDGVAKCAPTVDAEPVKHSKWIETDEYDEFYGRLYRCSNCNTFVIGDMDNYCSYCGARMDEE